MLTIEPVYCNITPSLRNHDVLIKLNYIFLFVGGKILICARHNSEEGVLKLKTEMYYIYVCTVLRFYDKVLIFFMKGMYVKRIIKRHLKLFADACILNRHKDFPVKENDTACFTFII